MVFVHCPFTQASDVQNRPSSHCPHEPPHPSDPHCFPPQAGVHVDAQSPDTHCWLALHWPQLPPQPSLPQVLPVQSAVQVPWAQVPFWQENPAEQLPQTPPHPSLPQDFPEQLVDRAQQPPW